MLLLLLANAVWFGWSRGWLPADLLPWPLEEAQREPQRLAAQVHPERVRIAAGAPARPGGEPTACLQAGPLDDEALTAIEAALAAAGLPTQAWQRVSVDGALWLRVAEADAAQQDTLRAVTALSAPSLPGGGFSACD